MTLESEQVVLCRRYGADYLAMDERLIAGVSRHVRSCPALLNGLRQPPIGGTSGWFIWAGEYSEAADFFEPLHVAHLAVICPKVLPYLGLAPGWRFLLAPDQVDVWLDEKLLSIGSFA